MSDKKNKYQVFDSADDLEPLQLKTTSNNNIRRVCEILCNSIGKTEEERMYYAEQGEIQPETDKDTGDRLYRFKIEYPTINVMWAALTEALFYGAPSLVKWNEDSEEYEISDGQRVDE
ncbi:MAG: hypothetical protein LC650_03435, partial [Actinobacteria bacterium]|nr:hypothetical protein [Actinomycetota bacterium]